MYHSTLGLRVIEKKKKQAPLPRHDGEIHPPRLSNPSITLNKGIPKSGMLHTTFAFDTVPGLKTRVDDPGETLKFHNSVFKIEPVSAWAGRDPCHHTAENP